VGNREIKLDSERSPSAAIRDVGLFDGRVLVKHGLAADLVGAAVEVASNVRQHGALQIFIFKEQSAPGMIDPAVRQIIAERIRIVEAGVCILIKGRVGIRRAFLICR